MGAGVWLRVWRAWLRVWRGLKFGRVFVCSRVAESVAGSLFLNNAWRAGLIMAWQVWFFARGVKIKF